MIDGNAEDPQSLAEAASKEASATISSLTDKVAELQSEIRILNDKAFRVGREHLGKTSLYADNIDTLNSRIKSFEEQLQAADKRALKWRLVASERSKSCDDLREKIRILKQNAEENAGLAISYEIRGKHLDEERKRNKDWSRSYRDLEVLANTEVRKLSKELAEIKRVALKEIKPRMGDSLTKLEMAIKNSKTIAELNHNSLGDEHADIAEWLQELLERRTVEIASIARNETSLSELTQSEIDAANALGDDYIPRVVIPLANRLERYAKIEECARSMRKSLNGKYQEWKRDHACNKCTNYPIGDGKFLCSMHRLDEALELPKGE